MDAQTKKSIELRNKIKSKKPDFVRQDSHKKAKLGDSYRKPRGLQSKMRLHKRGYNKTPSQGYRSPVLARNLTDDGLAPFVVYSIKDLDRINPENECVIIASTVGNKKRIDILKTCVEKKINVANFKDVDKKIKELEEERKKTKEEKDNKISAREQKRRKKKEEAEKKDNKDKKSGVEEKVDDEEKKKKDKEEKDKIIQKKQ